MNWRQGFGLVATTAGATHSRMISTGRVLSKPLSFRSLGWRWLSVCVLGFAVISPSSAAGEITPTKDAPKAVAREDSSPVPTESETDGKERCPRCDKRGKEECTQCEGKGQIGRKCRRCEGTGRRACTACDQDGKESTGRLICSQCDGDGKVSDDRECPTCRGAGSFLCSACLGRSERKCPKLIFDRICPTCRFVGKVTCRVCDGKKWLTSDRLTARLTELKSTQRGVNQGKSGDETSTDGSAKNAANANASSGAEGETQATKKKPATPSDAELEADYRRVTQTYDEHLDIFSDDLRIDLEYVLEDLKIAEKKLYDAAEDAAVSPSTLAETGEMLEIRRRVREFEQRWERLHPIFLKEHKSFRQVSRLWESWREVEHELAGGALRRRRRELERNISTVTKITLSHGQALAKLAPETLTTDAVEIKQLWKELETSTQRRIADLAIATTLEEPDDAEDRKETDKATVVSTPGDPTGHTTRSAASERKQPGNTERRRPSGNDTAGAPDANASQARSAASESPDKAPGQGDGNGEAAAHAPDSDAGVGGIVGVFIGVLVGFIGAWMVLRWKQEQVRPAG